ncbi:uncharacterized protein LOC110185964 [Drosophila serrata]|uniref:uncharacterized protein LOC110185964 n=1 Tax=Drosophila serrata TaxID=7274 RepID=UPI000A1D349C|nr:uncharacterized protein LOC110185964 [Drosophila serrata]
MQAPRPVTTPSTARKQYQPTGNATSISQQPLGTPTSQKRTHQAGRSAAKENCPARVGQRSSKNYPAPQPPLPARRQVANNDLTNGGASKATPLAQRRQLPATPKLSLKQQRNGCTHNGEGAGSSTGSSDSHDSPRLKKAFSNKFPQGLPFEEEFYGRNRSYSQSSSNYSFYSSVGAPTTPHDDDDDDRDVVQNGRAHCDEDDEFQRKPATDESLYVDFSKMVHSHQQRQYVPASSWIRASPDEDELIRTKTTSQLTPAQQRRRNSKYARSMHEYLYSDETEQARTKHRLSVVDEPEDGYYSYAAGTPEPHPSPPPTPRTDIYVAAASWAPKPLYPDRVLLPPADGNNNHQKHHHQHQQQQRRRPEHLGSTTCEYNFDDSISSRRRKERSKRSHRKSPASSRRQHKYRYRDEASHSSSRRRHRDRPKDERDSGRQNRQSQAKRYLEKSQQVADHFESSQIPCYIKMRELPAPPCVDHCRDLILASCPLRFMPYTEDWIVVEYFADHDSDYLFSPAKIQFFRQLEQKLIIRHAAKTANGFGLETELEQLQEEEEQSDEECVPITRCLLLKRQRNHFDLVAICDMPCDKYAGDNWIVEEYFVDHNDDYLH